MVGTEATVELLVNLLVDASNVGFVNSPDDSLNCDVSSFTRK